VEKVSTCDIYKENKKIITTIIASVIIFINNILYLWFLRNLFALIFD